MSTPFRSLLFEKKPNLCVFCGYDKGLTADHIVPLSKGGKNAIENLQILCNTCNELKDNRYPYTIDDYVRERYPFMFYCYPCEIDQMNEPIREESTLSDLLSVDSLKKLKK